MVTEKTDRQAIAELAMNFELAYFNVTNGENIDFEKVRLAFEELFNRGKFTIVDDREKENE